MDGLTLVNDAEKLGEALAKDGVTVSQLRKFLSAVNSISNKVEATGELNSSLLNEVQFLRIKLAYQTGRNETLQLLFEKLDPMIKEVKTTEDYKTLAKYVEAIIAYHKFNGGN